MRVPPAIVLIFLIGCAPDSPNTQTLFTNVAGSSGISFRNDLTITERFNPYTYRNFYNGAGVAIGDLNNDGLADVYFSGNQVDNKLYINKGNFLFEDQTDKAGVSCHGSWSSGVTFVDINADGFLDIYVCKSGDPETPRRSNELFINNKDLTFTESAHQYGLDIKGLSVQAAFFDYDRDGDLDCYLLTNSIRSVGNYDLIKDQRNTPDAQGGGNKFFINEKGKFKDYSAEAGIYRSSIGFGLGITLGDFNSDTWTDVFISNDFFERDYLYINDQHGSFKESLTDYFRSISMGSMGADFADLDGDAVPELFVTEMLPDSLNRKKTKTVFESWDKYQLNVQNGYYHQFSRNVLEKKIGNNSYAEVGRLSGVSASEWSWGALLFDMDNDGRRDIFIANGIYKDLLDRDYLAYTAAEENVRTLIREKKNAIMTLIDLMPSSPVSNYAYRNDGELQFTNTAREWGLDEPMFSCGSAYGDLDNDGDLDLVINNTNATAAVFRNNTDTTKFRSLIVELSAEGSNRFAMGSLATAFCNGRSFFSDNFVARGFQSSVQSTMHIGLGEKVNIVDSLSIQWPDGKHSMIYNVPVNKVQHINQTNAGERPTANVSNKKDKTFRIELVSSSLFKHVGSGVIDFNRDRLLPMMYSNETPGLVKGNIDGNGPEEIYIDGGKGEAGAIIRYNKGKFESVTPDAFKKYALSEETKGALLDVDKDGDLDLYMACGGRFFPGSSSALTDRIFLNNGNGIFSESSHRLPFKKFVSTSVSVSIDFDKDGDLDLLVGERFEPFTYGRGGGAYLLESNGAGEFKDVTAEHAPGISSIGMVTDAVATDIDNDGWTDFVLVGDWMSIAAFKNSKGQFTDASKELGVAGTEGWWHSIIAADLNKDGKPDFVAGNHGLNTFFKSGDRMYVSDFDKNGSVEQIFCTRVGDNYYPVVDRDELVSQMPSLKKQLLYYKDYGKRSIDKLFSESVLQDSKVFEVKLLSSVALMSGAKGYEIVDLPREAQYSTIYGLAIADFDKDGVEDLIAGGNQYQVKPQFGRYDASNGWFFKGRREATRFTFGAGVDLNVKGQIRDIEYIEADGTKFLFFAKHDDNLEIYKILN